MCKRAFKDTKAFFGWNKRTLLLPLFWCGGGIFYWQWQGVEAMLEEVAVAIAFGLIPVGIFAFLLFIYNLIRAPVFLRFEKEREPRLRIKEVIWGNAGAMYGGNLGLLVSNGGLGRAEDCRGYLVEMEFANPSQNQSLFRWPQNCPLLWAEELARGEYTENFAIPGKTDRVLEVAYFRPSSHSTTDLYLAYVGSEQFRQGHALKVSDGILIVVSVTSKDAFPIYAICLLGTEVGFDYRIELLAIKTECPTIDECRQLLNSRKVDSPT